MDKFKLIEGLTVWKGNKQYIHTLLCICIKHLKDRTVSLHQKINKRSRVLHDMIIY